MTHGAPAPYSTPLEYEKTKAFQFGTTKLTLPALKINDNTVIYVLNLMGGDSNNYVALFANELLYSLDFDRSMRGVMPVDGFISPEGKSIPLIYEISLEAERPYVVLRKSCKPYMGEKVLSTKVKSITTPDEQELYMDSKDLKWIIHKRLVFVDDVISSGATFNACEKIVNMAGGQIVGSLVAAIEGNYSPTVPTCSLAKLPVIKI